MRCKMKRTIPVLLMLSAGADCIAGIDKVYHPYVEPYVTELELRSAYSIDSQKSIDGKESHRLAVGYGVTERFSVELYLIGEKLPEGGLALEAYELESLLQLSEQGELWADWGLLFELEKARDQDRWESAVGLLWEKEWGRWSSAANVIAAYEYGSDVDNEVEGQFAAQWRYRYSPGFEPAIELYTDENVKGIGPVIMGVQRIGFHKLSWELGLILALDNSTPDQTLRGLLEYEF